MYSENLSISTKNDEISMFDKRTVVELSENEMTEVDGGTSSLCVLTIVLLIHYALK
jgi:hypothetical protein